MAAERSCCSPDVRRRRSGLRLQQVTLLGEDKGSSSMGRAECEDTKRASLFARHSHHLPAHTK